jgi:hypothetical protein
MEHNYIEEQTGGGVPIKMWTRGVPVEEAARRQLQNAARLPVVPQACRGDAGRAFRHRRDRGLGGSRR